MGAPKGVCEIAPSRAPVALVVSSDSELSDQLAQLLQSDHACQIERVSSYKAAQQVVESRDVHQIFLDLRSPQSPAGLLSYLARRGELPQDEQRPMVIALGQQGYVLEWAGRGTLLLDEIDVLEPSQQAKLLRVIETGQFEPVGSNDTRQSQARLIVTSNVNLETLMQQDRFRADLYYRLNVMEFHLPPLRSRPRNIAPMSLRFVQEFCQAHRVSIRRIHPEFLNGLKNYSWPGNIRELKNHVRRAVLLNKRGELTINDLAPVVALAAQSGAADREQPQENKTLSQRVACSE